MKVKILCVIPSLPSEVNLHSINSVLSQTIKVSDFILATEVVDAPFPTCISLALNNILGNIRLENYDYLLRVDSDAILPSDFLEKNLAYEPDALGSGFAQLIKVKPFLKLFNGKFNLGHDDGYIIEKMKLYGLNASWKYVNPPVLCRAAGFHRGLSWFISQGEIMYMYGDEPFQYLFDLLQLHLKDHGVYVVFEFLGFMKALLTHKKRFDIANRRLYDRLQVYCEPKRLLKVTKYLRYKL